MRVIVFMRRQIFAYYGGTLRQVPGSQDFHEQPLSCFQVWFTLMLDNTTVKRFWSRSIGVRLVWGNVNIVAYGKKTVVLSLIDMLLRHILWL